MGILFKRSVGILSLIIPFLVGCTQVTLAADTTYTWKPLRVGAGGWLTGVDISPDGSTLIVRADTYGAYVWDSGLGQWQQLVTASRMPAADVGVDKHDGVYEIRVAPNLSTRLYMAYRGYVYRSDDRGTRWTRTSFARVKMYPNDKFRAAGQKMAVDPLNADVVYVGTPESGLFATTDGGKSWQRVSAVPPGAQSKGEWPGVTGIVFDRKSGATDGRTKMIYVSSYGNGVWRTTDAGTSWTRISGGSLGGPGMVRHAVVGTDSVYYAASDDAQNRKPNGVWRYSTGGWQDINPGGQYWHSVAIDPFDAGRLVIGSDGGGLNVSHDRGTSWRGQIHNVTRQATDIPWLGWTQEGYMSNGDMVFDPVKPNLLWFAQGIGVWRTTVSGRNQSAITWVSQSVGIEQLVANSIAAPPGGKPVLASWDRALFTVNDPDVFPSRHGPTSRFNMGWHIDYASTDPSFLVAFVSDIRGQIGDGLDLQSSYSTDRGQTWTRFPAMPLNSNTSWDKFGFGTGAVSTPDNFIWVPSNKRAPYYTKDRARSWQKVTLPGVADTQDGWTGLHWANYLARHIVTADRVTPGIFYMYHTPKGLFRSTDGGSTWTLAHAGEIAPFSGFNAKLRAVPGHAGHLFFTSGPQGGDGSVHPAGAFMRSTDGGMTWSAVPKVMEVHAFGFGKEAPGVSYPALYIAGWVNGIYGIWRSDDVARNSWTRIGDFPLGSLDAVRAVEGDKDVYGKVYIGFGGSGYAYGALATPEKRP